MSEYINNNPSKNFVTFLEPDSAVSEAYRILRTNISLKDFDRRLQIINVISYNAQSSKSTTILNLAYTFSQLDKKVLLIDLDLRLPSIHKKLKLKNEKGITDVVSHQCSFNDAVIHYSYKFDVLLSGTKTPFSSEFIQSKSFNMFIEELRTVYDYVFIDCPPIGLVSDGIIASNYCDGTFFCVASEHEEKKDLEKAKDLLQQFKVNILGIVMTRVPFTKKNYKYDYSGYGYGYTNDKSKKKRKKK